MKIKYVPLLLLPFMAVAESNNIVAEISQYVYPNNRVKSSGVTHLLNDGNSYLKAIDNTSRIARFDLLTGEQKEIVFDATHTREGKISTFDSFIVSADESKILLSTETSAIYRRSSRSVWWIFDVKRNILRPLSRETAYQQSPLFSPDSRMVAFVSDGDISVRKLDYDTEVRVTDNAVPGKIINGVPDWTYEEEFSTSCSMAWSADSETLCFVTYDETNVPLYSFALYQGACDPMDQYALYPGQFSYKYPVAGQPNSVVSVNSYDISTRKIKQLPIGDRPIEYIPRIDFAVGGNQLFVTTLDRSQQRMEIFSVNPKSTIAKSIIVEQAPCWIEPEAYENLTFTSSSIIVQSSRSGFSNLYEYNFTGSLLRNLTPIERDVTAIYGQGADGNWYYQTVDDGVLNRSVYRTDRKMGEVRVYGGDGWYDAVFTKDMKYCLLSFSNSSTPTVTTLYNVAGKQVRIVQDNAEYASKFAGCAVPEFITIPSDGYQLNAYLIKPKNFDPSKSYPLIMTQYSGPGSQSVANKWMMDWEKYAVEKGFVVACVDPRGTGNRGRAFMNVVYKDLGHYETIDQINAARYLASMPWIDSDRIGLTGWSYGGYETLMCATEIDNPFKVAVAIAPVTDWRYYDTVYTERYMATPGENEDGYNASAPVKRANNMSSKLLIMSGTADDNVHLSNTIEMVSHLQINGIFCDMLLFPNMNHSIYGCNSRAVVYGRMMDYFIANL